MPTIDLKELFLALQGELANTLQLSRDFVPHPGTKGDVSELKWVETLRDYLPARYEVEKAFVLDADGNLSDQIDIRLVAY